MEPFSKLETDSEKYSYIAGKVLLAPGAFVGATLVASFFLPVSDYIIYQDTSLINIVVIRRNTGKSSDEYCVTRLSRHTLKVIQKIHIQTE